MLKTYQTETKLFEFSRDMNSEELKIKTSDVTLQWFRCKWLRCNGFRFYVCKQSYHLP